MKNVFYKGIMMDKGILSILDELNRNKHSTLTDLCYNLGLSQRQLLYRINKINAAFEELGLTPISQQPKGMLYVDENTRAVFVDVLSSLSLPQHYVLSKEERLMYMYLMLFINLEYVLSNHFVDFMKVSRSLVVLDLKELNSMLEPYHVKVANNRDKGYYLVGSEINIRLMLMKLVITLLSENSHSRVFEVFISDFNLDNYQVKFKEISELATVHSISFIEDRLQEFVYTYIFLKARIESINQPVLDKSVYSMSASLIDTCEFEFTQSVLELDHLLDKIDASELTYIAGWIMGISVGHLSANTRDRVLISDLTNQILVRFEMLSGIHYKNYEEIFKQLYAHFRPAYYRLLFRIPIINPLGDRIQDEYTGLYRLVREVMKPFGTIFGYSVPSDEISYITVHFATIFSERSRAEIIDKKTAMIVCSNGIGSSAILYNELSDLFPEINFLLPVSSKEISSMKVHVDIIFTTIYTAELKDFGVPVIKVSPVMSQREKNSLMQSVGAVFGSSLVRGPSVSEIMQIVENYTAPETATKIRNALADYFVNNVESNLIGGGRSPMLSEVTSERLINLNIEASDWKDAIRKCAQCLVDNNAVEPRYVQAMIDTAKEAGPYIVITKHVAMPHARPEMGAKAIAISISTLKEPVSFGNKENDPVKYVFCLAAIDNETHLQSIAELVELLDTPEFFELLDCAKSSAEVYEFIKNHNHD